MRLWNLSSFEKLGTPVLLEQPPSATYKKINRPGVFRTSIALATIQVVAIAAISYNVAAFGTSHALEVPRTTGAGVTCNVDPERPPLESIFANRFDSKWTRVTEEELLKAAAKKSASPERDLFNLVQTAQHETVSEDAQRLTEDEVLKLPRRKV